MEVRMFMWQWQHVFQSAVESTIESIFGTLELEIPFRTFVIGIPIDNRYLKLSGGLMMIPSSERKDFMLKTFSNPSNPICTDRIFFHKEDCGFNSSDFENVFSLIEDNFLNDPEHDFFHSASHLNQAHKESLYPKAVRKAVQSILKSHDAKKKLVSFCSFPIQKNEHWIMTVIQLNQEDFDTQYRLTKEIHEVHSMRKHRIDRCFIEAVIYRILKEGEQELQRPSEGNISDLADSERVIEDAASCLINSIILHINTMGGNLLTFANSIAAERYEGGESKGRLIIAPREHQDISVEIKLKLPISTNNYRGIRKLLEVSSNELALLCDTRKIWGLGTPLDTYNSSLENLFEIQFAEHHTWELVHAENVMLRVEHRRPRLPKKRFDLELFYDHVYRLFNVDEDTAILLSKAVGAAVEQRHGTMLIITPEAQIETTRLKAQSTAIESRIISKKIISHISSVDGAILISPDGIIHSFGVILDGEASENGNPARGARFNSAIRYVDKNKNHNINCLALIVSEDGYVDLYPTLRKRIPRIWIDDILDELEQYANLAKPYDSDKAWLTLVRLGKLSFYLLKEDIERANKIKDEIVQLENQDRSKIMTTGMGYIMASFDNFTVHEEMNSEYYLPDESI